MPFIIIWIIVFICKIPTIYIIYITIFIIIRLVIYFQFIKNIIEFKFNR